MPSNSSRWFLAAAVSTAFGSVALATPVPGGLVLWLNGDTLTPLGDGTPVAVWTDNSPSANHATQGVLANQPLVELNAFAGHTAVDFDGADDFLALVRNTLPNGLTYFAVASTDDTSAAKVYPGNAALTVIGDSTNAIWNSFGVTGGKLEHNVFDSGWESTQSASSVSSLSGLVPHVLASRLTNSPSPFGPELFVDGVAETIGNTGSYSAGNIGYNRISGSFLNGTQPNTGDVFNGLIAEVLIYNRPLTDEEVGQVNAYLLNKYTVVPEPGTLVMVGVMGALVLRRRVV
jgi:hypothetical protein